MQRASLLFENENFKRNSLVESGRKKIRKRVAIHGALCVSLLFLSTF